MKQWKKVSIARRKNTTTKPASSPPVVALDAV
jgi:hypothetical protein